VRHLDAADALDLAPLHRAVGVAGEA
jgi:hypothetical protein